MHIHTVREGESVFSIANQYAVSPLSIIENNGLDNPDSLTVGEELLILIPSKSYSVRRDDTLSGIARRFGVRKSEIHANNPVLLGNDDLYEGQLLSIKFADARLGMGASNGYFFRGCSNESLRRAIPYLTYVTVCAAKAEGGRTVDIFNGTDVVNATRPEGKIPILRVYDTNTSEIYSSDTAKERYIDDLISKAKSGGYSGITLSAPCENIDKTAYEDFILKLRRDLIGSDLILFAEVSAGLECSYADYADGSILSYEKIGLPRVPDFETGERAFFKSYAETSESAKTFMDISSFAFDGMDYIAYNDALQIARKAGNKIERNDATGVCRYKDTSRRGASRAVCFESLKNIKAKLDLIGELGFMGISFDISRCPIAHLMMYNALFSGICYASIFSSESEI